MRDVTVFLCGDVMLGRGVDQVLPHPGDPRIHECWLRSAGEYVALAEAANGAIPKPCGFDYVWGDALAALERAQPAVRIVNLETSVTRSAEPWPKGINYRMNPDNVGCLTAARIDCCVLANNHVLDWGRRGLLDTLAALRGAAIRSAGAGRNGDEAAAPAILPIAQQRRVLVFAFACASSGVPEEWAAADQRAGVNLLPDLLARTAERVARAAARASEPGDIAVASIHWGDNWGYEATAAERKFAHRLIEGGFAIVHGHSSHHFKGVEIYRDRPILYGCGDFLNDYEGIRGYEAFRADLALMYLPRFAPASARLTGMVLIPFRIRNFRLMRCGEPDASWICATLNRESARLGSRFALQPDATLVLQSA